MLTQFNSNSRAHFMGKIQFNCVYTRGLLCDFSPRSLAHSFDGDYCKVNSLNNFNQSTCDNFSQSFSILHWARYRGFTLHSTILLLLYHVRILSSYFPRFSFSFLPFLYLSPSLTHSRSILPRLIFLLFVSHPRAQNSFFFIIVL